MGRNRWSLIGDFVSMFSKSRIYSRIDDKYIMQMISHGKERVTDNVLDKRYVA